jgi:HD-GYP domain-containing protein (c-di-GMP phosphodiesterase class II)
MKFNMKKCLQAFSIALDLAEIDYFNITLNHSRRVAYLSVMIGRMFELSHEELFDLFSYAILHDNGLVLSLLKDCGKAYEITETHCFEGEANVIEFPFIKKRENIIKFHHENHNGSGFFGLSGNDIPFFSAIIHLADFLDNNFNIVGHPIEQKEQVYEYVDQNSGKLFDPKVVEAFKAVTKSYRFWFDLEFYSIDEVLDRIVPEYQVDLSWGEIEKISRVMVEIIDSKSRFTQTHTTGLVNKIELMSRYYGMDSEKRCQMRIAGNLHDIGKLYVPHAILDKPGRLDEREFLIVRHHTYYTKLILDKIPGFDLISQWAANHHEKLNGKGYPEGLTGSELDFESRLIAVLDIYQALTEERPYRTALSHEKASDILMKMAEECLIDPEIVNDVKQVMSEMAPEKKTKVALIVDDDKYNIKLLEKFLKDKGIETTRASSGYEALDLINKNQFQYCFIDVHMPGIDGIQTVQIIRKEENKDNPMIIVGVSANTTEDNRKSCLKAGMNLFLEKPLFKEKIDKIIQRFEKP